MTVDDDEDENRVQGIVLLTDEARQYLNPREEIAYQEHRRELAEWMLNLGKNPKKAEGYSYSTAKSRMNKLDLFYRWVWEQENRFIQDMTTDHADAWMRSLAKQDLKESTKCHYQKTVQTAVLNSDLISRYHRFRREKPRKSNLVWRSTSSTSLSSVVT